MAKWIFDNDPRHEQNWKWSEGCWKDKGSVESFMLVCMRPLTAPSETCSVTIFLSLHTLNTL